MVIIIITAIVGIVIDQLTKYWSIAILAKTATQQIDIIPNVFRFSYVENRGAVFGILQGQQWLFYVMTFIFVAAIVFVMIKYRKKLTVYLDITIGLILAGAIGNFIDRVSLGFVRDMFDFYLFDFWTWIFNFADICLVVGVIMAVIYMFFVEPKREKKIAK